MLGKTVQFVGGPMCGERTKAKYHELGELVFLARCVVDGHPPFVHIYASRHRGADFEYQGAREYAKSDHARILGTVP